MAHCGYQGVHWLQLVQNAINWVFRFHCRVQRPHCGGKPIHCPGLFSSVFFVSDGELYAGTVSNFQGNEPIIYKSLGHGTALKTENSLNWLQGKVIVLLLRLTFYSIVQSQIRVNSPNDPGKHPPIILFSKEQNKVWTKYNTVLLTGF